MREKYELTKVDRLTHLPAEGASVPVIHRDTASQNYSTYERFGTSKIDSVNADRIVCAKEMPARMARDRTVKGIFCTHQENLVAVGLVSRHAETLLAFNDLEIRTQQEIPSTELVYLVTNKTKGAGQAIIQSLFHRTLDVEPLWLEAGPSQVLYFEKFGFTNRTNDKSQGLQLLWILPQKLMQKDSPPLASDQHGASKSSPTDVK